MAVTAPRFPLSCRFRLARDGSSHGVQAGAWNRGEDEREPSRGCAVRAVERLSVEAAEYREARLHVRLDLPELLGGERQSHFSAPA